MKLHEAIEILKKHNEWRRDDEFPSKLEVTNPVELGIAIDIVVKSHEVIKELENIMERWNLGREEDSDVDCSCITNFFLKQFNSSSFKSLAFATIDFPNIE